jgi:hypothetical protein
VTAVEVLRCAQGVVSANVAGCGGTGRVGTMGFLDKAKDLLAKNAGKVDTVIDKAGDLVDKKTQGKYASTVDKVQEAAKKAARENASGSQAPGTGPQTPGTPSQTPVTPPQQQPPTAPPTS